MPRTYVLDMMTHGWRIRILRCAGELRRLTRAWRLVQGAGLLTAVVADHAAISRETMYCLDDGYVHVVCRLLKLQVLLQLPVLLPQLFLLV